RIVSPYNRLSVSDGVRTKKALAAHVGRSELPVVQHFGWSALPHPPLDASAVLEADRAMPLDRIFVGARRGTEEHPAVGCSKTIFQGAYQRSANTFAPARGEDADELDPGQAPDRRPREVADDLVVVRNEELFTQDLALKPVVLEQEPLRRPRLTELILDGKQADHVGYRGRTNRGHFGGIRSAPSRRIVSPFRNAFSMMWRASAAYSDGSPRRFGCGIWSANACRVSSGSSASIGVFIVPGPIVQMRISRPGKS